MVDERNRIPVDQNYLVALGRATYNFAYLEWGIVWLWECLDRGSIRKVQKMTAGQIASGFSLAVRQVAPNHPLTTRLIDLANEFKVFVADRNTLIHANPYTALGGEQRLLSKIKAPTTDWTIQEINSFSDHAAVLAIEAGALLRGGLYDDYSSTETISGCL